MVPNFFQQNWNCSEKKESYQLDWCFLSDFVFRCKMSEDGTQTCLATRAGVVQKIALCQISKKGICTDARYQI